MSAINFLGGQVLTSTALSRGQAQSMIQLATALSLGMTPYPLNNAAIAALPSSLVATLGSVLTSELQVELTLSAAQFTAQASSVFNLYALQRVACPGLPVGTQISKVGPGNLVWLTNASGTSSTQLATITDPAWLSNVRVGWQQQGQPAWGVNQDVCIVRAEPLDTEYGRMRNMDSTTTGDINTVTDVFTNGWRVYWSLYGPNSYLRSQAIISALITLQFIADFLGTANWYVNPDIQKPQSVPELFQSQWWERSDFYADFNEQVTETYLNGTVLSVPVALETDGGLQETFTVTSGE